MPLTIRIRNKADNKIKDSPTKKTKRVKRKLEKLPFIISPANKTSLVISNTTIIINLFFHFWKELLSKNIVVTIKNRSIELINIRSVKSYSPIG